MATKILKTKTSPKQILGGLVSRHQIIDKIMTLITPIWDSKVKKLKPRMTIAQACSEVGTTSVTYHTWLKEDPLLAQMVDDVKNSHRQMMDDMAGSIVLEWLNGDVKLRPNEKIQLAKWYLEKTSPYFNPSQKIEVEGNQTHYHMSEEEIINRIKELSQETWEEILLPTLTLQEDVQFTSSDNTQESDDEEETTSSESSTWGSPDRSWD